MSNNNTTFWQSLKQAFAYGLGGTLGWHVGNLLAWLARKAWLLILAGPFVYGLATMDTTTPAKDKPAVQQRKAVAHTTQPTENNPHLGEKKPESGG